MDLDHVLTFFFALVAKKKVDNFLLIALKTMGRARKLSIMSFLFLRRQLMMWNRPSRIVRTGRSTHLQAQAGPHYIMRTKETGQLCLKM